MLHACVSVVSLSPRPTSCSTGCIVRDGDVIHLVLWEVGLGNSQISVSAS